MKLLGKHKIKHLAAIFLTCFVIPFSLFPTISDASANDWIKSVGGFSGSVDADIQSDANNNCYVFGGCDVEKPQAGSVYPDVFIRKFSTSGKLLWSKRFGSLMEDFGYDIAIESTTGAVYFVGMEEGDGGFLRKYSRDGKLLWKRSFYEPINTVDIGARGNICITGLSSTSGQSYIRKYTPTGKLLWKKDLKISFQIRSLSINGSGDIFVAGDSRKEKDEGQYTGVFVRKYNSKGNMYWTRNWGFLPIPPYTNLFSMISVNKQGIVDTMKGLEATTFARRTSTGEVIWRKTWRASDFTDLKGCVFYDLDSQNNMYVIGNTTIDKNTSEICLRKYSDTKSLLIHRHLARGQAKAIGFSVDKKQILLFGENNSGKFLANRNILE